MPFPTYWTDEKIAELKILYASGLSMKEVGKHFDKTEWAVNSIMRRKNFAKRPAALTRHLQFTKSPLSFIVKRSLSIDELNLKVAGLMLYWGEGAKRQKHCLDFANSDPKMVQIFLQFLRTIYQVNEARLRVYLYCHDKQLIERHIHFWTQITSIPTKQFTKPYVHTTSTRKHAKMQHGLVHIRYADKRLLEAVMNDLNNIITRWGTQVDNEVRL